MNSINNSAFTAVLRIGHLYRERDRERRLEFGICVISARILCHGVNWDYSLLANIKYWMFYFITINFAHSMSNNFCREPMCYGFRATNLEARMFGSDPMRFGDEVLFLVFIYTII